MKVYLYSRGVISVLKIGQELGYYECVRERDERRFVTAETMICMASMIFLCYCYLFEINAMPKSFVATMTKACGLAPDEMRFFDSLRAHLLQIPSKYQLFHRKRAQVFLDFQGKNFNLSRKLVQLTLLDCKTDLNF